MKKYSLVNASAFLTVSLISLQAFIVPTPKAIAQTSFYSPSENNLQQKAEKFVNALSQQKFDDATKDLNQSVKKEWTAFNVQQYWQDLLKQTGKFQKQIKSTQVNQNLVLVTIKFDKVTEDLFVIFDSQGNITGVDFPTI